MENERISLVECPRDAMQGMKELIPTNKKIAYHNLLLKAGFDILDFGSFVSPKAIPQMADTKEVLAGLDLSGTDTKLLAIVANERGASEAAAFDEISFLGYPFSVSPTFQLRNTNSNSLESLKAVEKMQDIASRNNKTLLVYLSMAFGNPYGDDYHPDVVVEWAKKISDMGVHEMALADTIGSSNPQSIDSLFKTVLRDLPDVSFGAHLHTTPETWKEKVEASWKAGCRRFDGAIRGYGGCPMAKDDLTGNMPTEKILEFASQNNIATGINKERFQEAFQFSNSIFLE